MSYAVQARTLSWRVMNYDTNQAPTKDVFLMGDSLYSQRQAVELQHVCSEISNKWTREIEKSFADTKTHFEIAGGNYTFFFVLPPLFKPFRKRHPFVKLKLDLLELRDGKDLTKKNADLVFSSRSFSDTGDVEDYSVGAEEFGYSVLRKNYPEFGSFAVPSWVVAKYGGKKNVLQRHDFIDYRFHVTIDSHSEQDQKHYDLLKEIDKSSARYTVGLYPLGYEMMLDGVGTFRVHKHNAKKQGITILDHVLTKMERFLIAKNTRFGDVTAYKKTLRTYLCSRWTNG